MAIKTAVAARLKMKGITRAPKALRGKIFTKGTCRYDSTGNCYGFPMTSSGVRPSSTIIFAWRIERLSSEDSGTLAVLMQKKTIRKPMAINIRNKITAATGDFKSRIFKFLLARHQALVHNALMHF